MLSMKGVRIVKVTCLMLANTTEQLEIQSKTITNQYASLVTRLITS